MENIEGDEIISLFKILSRHEDELDAPLRTLKTRIDREIYRLMSIAEVEKLMSVLPQEKESKEERRKC